MQAADREDHTLSSMSYTRVALRDGIKHSQAQAKYTLPSKAVYALRTAEKMSRA